MHANVISNRPTSSSGVGELGFEPTQPDSVADETNPELPGSDEGSTNAVVGNEIGRAQYFDRIDAPSRDRAEALARDLADSFMPCARRSSASHRITLGSDVAAGNVFSRAADAMLDVNHWGDGLGPLSADFALFDARGHAVAGRAAQVGDMIRVDLPGPAPFSWVRVESMEMTDSRVSMTVRPSYDPTERPIRPDVTAHFFTSSATNTFALERRDNRVRLSVEGRNEVPNVRSETSGAVEPLLNRATTIGAWGTHEVGFQSVQWNLWTEGLLDRARRD